MSQALLDSPNPNSPANNEAAKLYQVVAGVVVVVVLAVAVAVVVVVVMLLVMVIMI